MSRPFSVKCAALLVLSTGLLFTTAKAADQDQQQIDAQLRAGKVIFDSTCSTAACHGTNGVGGRGPALNHRLAENIILDAVLNGRPGTPMPHFKDVLDIEKRTQVIAYVSSLSSAGRLPRPSLASAVASPIGQPEPMPWIASNASSNRVVIDSEYGDPAAGAVLFFDATKLTSCHSCHSYARAGGPIGVDLRSIDKTPLEVCRTISEPKMASVGYPAIRITMIGGSTDVGIKSEENNDTLSYYDVSAPLPILRNVLKSEVENVEPLTGSGIYDHTALPYGRQDQLNVCAFLGKTHRAEH